MMMKWIWFGVGVLGGLGGCRIVDDPEEPCGGLRLGDRLSITIVEAYDQNSQFLGGSTPPSDCHLALDLTPGRVLTATIVDFTSSFSCQSGIAEFDQVGEWTWTRSGTGSGTEGARLLQSSFVATRGMCSGNLEVKTQGSVALPSSEPIPGQQPPIILVTNFRGTSGGGPDCPIRCNMPFVIRLAKL